MSVVASFRRMAARLNHSHVATVHDLLMAAGSFVLALYLRLGEHVGAALGDALPWAAGAFVLLCAGIFYALRFYRAIWRYASIQDLIGITKAVTLAIFLFYLGLFFYNRLETIPRAVPVIHWLLMMAMLGAPRFAYRMLKDGRFGLEWSLAPDQRVPVLLIGATDNAELFIRQMAGRDGPYKVVGLVDDDPARIGRKIHNVDILGDVRSLPDVLDRLQQKGKMPQKMLLTDRDLAGEQVRKLLEFSDQAALPLARLPRLTEFRHSSGNDIEMRPIAIEDLLGRPQNPPDIEAMRRFIKGRRVLITGAGGTIGSELARQVAGFAPQQLVLLELSEYHLYQMEQELNAAFPAAPLFTHIADVRDREQMGVLFEQYCPDVIFHAAALKHVPIAEANIVEAVRTNVLGTKNVADMARAFGVKEMVLISTDKAVNPTNIMGATKRAAECYCQALEEECAKTNETRFITVRFGNVLGSTGSVVPLFRRQLESGGPLTVTHPDMLRYFMTVKEAVGLVVQAAVLGKAETPRRGGIFVLDMGKPVRIEDLALQMIRLAGLKPHRDIEIVYTGLRPGEKLFEELFHAAEPQERTAHESIFLSQPRHVDMVSLKHILAQLEEVCHTHQSQRVVPLVKYIVPEYHADRSQRRKSGKVTELATHRRVKVGAN